MAEEAMGDSLRKIVAEHKMFVLIFLFALGLRMWHITNPLIDIHSWRQCASAMVARNYMANMNFFQPALDLDNRYPMAYGLYEYVVGLLGKAVGFSDILGRLFSVGMFLFGFVYFYKLVEMFFSRNAALWACAFYAFLPTSAYYSRNFQPDASMVAMTIVFLYYFALWVDEDKWQYYLLSVIFANLSFLFKIPSLFILVPAAGYLFIKEGIRIFIDWRWYLFVFLSAAFPLFFHWYVPIATHGMMLSAFFSQDKWAGKSVLLDWTGFWWERFYINLSEFQLTHTGYFIFLFGLFKPMTDRKQWLFYYWAAGVLAFFISSAKGMTHEYYWLPFIPVACVFMGRFCVGYFGNWKERWRAGGIKRAVLAFVCLMVIYSFGFSIIRYDDRCKLFINYKQISDVVKANTTAEDKILVISRSELEVFYYARRHGNHLRDLKNLAGYFGNCGFAPGDIDVAALKTSLRDKSGINEIVLAALGLPADKLDALTADNAARAMNAVLINPDVYRYVGLVPEFYIDNITDYYNLAKSGHRLDENQLKVLNRKLLQDAYSEALKDSSLVDGNTIDKYKALAITDYDVKKDSPQTYGFLKARYPVIADGSFGIVFKLK
jgi:hypothetical protein